MATGLSLHIGINQVDPRHYGSQMPLKGAVPDAKDMYALATKIGYEAFSLTDSAATTGNVAKRITKFAQRLKQGDIALITYAGHGSQIFDAGRDETDALDETWCLYDRMLIDDEIYRLLGYFDEGVRVLIVSDSCHSGTAVRLISNDIPSSGTEVFRALPIDDAGPIVELHQNTYNAAKFLSYRSDIEELSASVELLAACQDHQLAKDLGSNGLFTQNLISTWDGGSFQGNHPQFFDNICAFMPPEQMPNRLSLGPGHPKFQTGKPFEI